MSLRIGYPARRLEMLLSTPCSISTARSSSSTLLVNIGSRWWSNRSRRQTAWSNWKRTLAGDCGPGSTTTRSRCGCRCRRPDPRRLTALDAGGARGRHRQSRSRRRLAEGGRFDRMVGHGRATLRTANPAVRSGPPRSPARLWIGREAPDGAQASPMWPLPRPHTLTANRRHAVHRHGYLPRPRFFQLPTFGSGRSGRV